MWPSLTSPSQAPRVSRLIWLASTPLSTHPTGFQVYLFLSDSSSIWTPFPILLSVYILLIPQYFARVSPSPWHTRSNCYHISIHTISAWFYTFSHYFLVFFFAITFTFSSLTHTGLVIYAWPQILNPTLGTQGGGYLISIYWLCLWWCLHPVYINDFTGRIYCLGTAETKVYIIFFMIRKYIWINGTTLSLWLVTIILEEEISVN